MSKKPLEDMSLEEIDFILGQQSPFGKDQEGGIELYKRMRMKNELLALHSLISYGIIIGQQMERRRKA